jgi:hypothetical protein
VCYWGDKYLTFSTVSCLLKSSNISATVRSEVFTAALLTNKTSGMWHSVSHIPEVLNIISNFKPWYKENPTPKNPKYWFHNSCTLPDVNDQNICFSKKELMKEVRWLLSPHLPCMSNTFTCQCILFSKQNWLSSQRILYVIFSYNREHKHTVLLQKLE